jgi:hypothetical protein
VINTHHIDTNKLLVFGKRGLEETEVAVDTSAWNADVKFAPEVFDEVGKAFLETLYAADVYTISFLSETKVR